MDPLPSIPLAMAQILFLEQATQFAEGTTGISKTHGAQGLVNEYLKVHSAVYARLIEIREQGWNNKAGDVFFQKQRENADRGDDRTAKAFYNMMKDIGHQMNATHHVFSPQKESQEGQTILDLCMAPGGMLEVALTASPGSKARAFSLPVAEGGHKVQLPKSFDVSTTFLDITMLPEDMGIKDLPQTHHETQNMLPRQFITDKQFDLIICDGQFLRSHKSGQARGFRESSRLLLTQLIIGLQQVKPHGTMIVLLHRIEKINTINLLYNFSQFATVELFKPVKFHAKRSSFYMIAKDVRNEQEEASAAMARWRRQWEVLTFGCDADVEANNQSQAFYVSEILRDFGPKLIRSGEPIWSTQADALSKAGFMKNATG